MSGTFPEVKTPVAADDGAAIVTGRLALPLQFTVVPGGSASGAGAVTMTPASGAGVTVGFEPVLDAAGDALVVDVTAQITHQLPGAGWISALKVTGADFTLIVSSAD